jgi:NitT/TauT family transport system substrate-binding protein
VAFEKGWYKEGGLAIASYQSYLSGDALSSALAAGYVDVAYMGLIPAVRALSSGGVPIKIVSGLYRCGYGLVADSRVLKNIQDLEKPGIRIGCPREGSSADLFLRKVIEVYGLNKNKVMKNVSRTDPFHVSLEMKKG